MRIAIAIGIGALGSGSSEPAIITATTAPSLGPLTDGETLSSAVTWGSYTSSEGTIVTPTTKEMSVNGGAFVAYDGNTVVSFDDTYTLREVVSDSVGNTRTFGAGTQTVAGIAPTITASDSLSGRTLTITVDTKDGVPTPTTSLTTLTLDGSPVSPNTTGTDVWTYDVPDSTESQTVAWEVTASNGVSPDATASGSEVVATRFLLDAYPGARGAWSVRALSSSTTNVMRVRRSSDGTERDLTEAEVTDGTLTTFAGAGSAFVKTLYDQSGNGWHATNTTTASQPRIVNSGTLITKNGKPSIDTDGVDDRLVAPVPSGASVPVSIFAVATFASGPDLQPLFDGRAIEEVNDFCLVYVPGGTSNLGLFNGTVLTSSSVFTAGTTALITANFRDPTSEGFVDGQSAVSGDAGVRPNNFANIAIGARVSPTNPGFWEGEISEVIYYNIDQSANQAAIEQNMADYFGVTL